MERPDMSNYPEAIRSYVAFQEEQLAQKDLRIESLTNIFLNLQKKQYGSRSEKNAIPPEVGEQLCMVFDEVEATADPKVPDETAVEQVQAHTRVRYASGVKAQPRQCIQRGQCAL